MSLGNWLWPSSLRRLFWAASTSLNTMANAVLLDRQPFERMVRCRTVAKVLSCESAWNKDPVFGVIGIQSGPRDDGSTVASVGDTGARLGMLVVETIAKIRRAYFAQKKPIKTICRELR